MARGRKPSLRIVLSSEERQTLERWQQSTTLAAGPVRWGRIILLLAAGTSHCAVAQAVGVQRTMVRHWAKRGFSPGGRRSRGELGLRATGPGGS
jgi:hypothetical protein